MNRRGCILPEMNHIAEENEAFVECEHNFQRGRKAGNLSAKLAKLLGTKNFWMKCGHRKLNCEKHDRRRNCGKLAERLFVRETDSLQRF